MSDAAHYDESRQTVAAVEARCGVERPTSVGRRFGLPATEVRRIWASKRDREVFARARSVRLDLASDVWTGLVTEAVAQGTTPSALAARLVTYAIDDSLVGAILDEGAPR